MQIYKYKTEQMGLPDNLRTTPICIRNMNSS